MCMSWEYCQYYTFKLEELAQDSSLRPNGAGNLVAGDQAKNIL